MDVDELTSNKKYHDILFLCGFAEIVHNGSLMVDDLEDRSLLRRGQPCTYIKYGNDVAVNTGTYMYYAPISRLGDFIQNDKSKFEILDIYSKEMANLHLGQNWDIHWHNGKKMPTEQ